MSTEPLSAPRNSGSKCEYRLTYVQILYFDHYKILKKSSRATLMYVVELYAPKKAGYAIHNVHHPGTHIFFP